MTQGIGRKAIQRAKVNFTFYLTRLMHSVHYSEAFRAHACLHTHSRCSLEREIRFATNDASSSRQAYTRDRDDSSAKSAIERPDAASSRGHLRGLVPRFIHARDVIHALRRSFSMHIFVALFQGIAAEH